MRGIKRPEESRRLFLTHREFLKSLTTDNSRVAEAENWAKGQAMLRHFGR